ncbi:hypothetical protein JCM19047_878 [Bacillus sp. JCM 19047]|uniref:hypothetical protein n=1 Tax=Shouchella miscanthi TaxID=2598861 RepID=UPI0003F00D7C|nr:hypothetical protein [Shouchella miscanthi]GAF21204.1 hypothetical protein JCM19047_878 [Bacillus sp. JCM 19047]
MSRSKAKKQREKRIREGKRNPALNRGVYAMADLATRKTKTKQEYMEQQRQKTRRFDESDEFFLVWTKIPLHNV